MQIGRTVIWPPAIDRRGEISMARYVDGFVVPVPKRNLDAYRSLSRKAGKIWCEYGALEYVECVGKRMIYDGFKSFVEF